MNLFLWRHELPNLFLLLRLLRSFLNMMKFFSWRHRLHFLLTLLYGWQVLSTLHLTQNDFLWSSSFQMYFDSSVSFLLLGCPIIELYSAAQNYPNYAYAYYTRVFCEYAYVCTRTCVRIYARICPFVIHSQKFLCMNHCSANKGPYEKSFKVTFAYC